MGVNLIFSLVELKRIRLALLRLALFKGFKGQALC